MFVFTGFQRLIGKLQPCYKLPGRTYFTKTVIPELYEKCKLTILESLTEIKWISLTTDMWTSDVNYESYISLTGHWVDKSFEKKHAVLSIRIFLEGTHTGENIRNILNLLLQENNIPQRKVHILLRDGGANIKKGAKCMGVSNETCFIHTLQLVVLDAMKSQRSVIDTVAAGRNIVTHLNHSAASRKKLEEQQKNLNMPIKKLVQDVPTRWNSSYYMLKRLEEQKRPLSLLAAENNNIPSLSPNQWYLVENLIILLEPFEEITRHFSSTMCAISEVIPTVFSLRTLLTKIEVPRLGTMRDTLIENLNTRFKDTELDTNPNFAFSTVLDPRFKCGFFKDSIKNHVEAELVKEINLISQAHTEEIDIEKPSTSNSVGSIPKSVEDNPDLSFDSDGDDEPLSNLQNLQPKKMKMSVWDVLSEVASTSVVEVPHEKSAEAELKSYLALPLIKRTDCPYRWWKREHTNFPILSTFALKYLSAPATTIFSERLFSEAGNVFEEKRNRLSAANGEMLVYLHHNIPLLDYKY